MVLGITHRDQGDFMKTLFITLFAFGFSAQAYSPQAAVLKAGDINIVHTDQGRGPIPGRVDVSLSVKTKSSQLPLIKSLNRSEKCQHLKTLISFAGYDQVRQLYVRTYEIQFLAQTQDPSRVCQFIVETDSGLPTAEKTRVVVLEFE